MPIDFYVDKNNYTDMLQSHAQESSLLNIDKNFQLGVQMHQQGKLQQAKEIYAEILACDPNNSQAWHLSGVVALQYNDPLLAAKLIAMAITLNPQEPAMYYNQALALERLGQYDEAITSYDKVILLKPDDVKAHINRGAVLKLIGKMDEAIASYNKAIAIKPDSAEAYSNRGNILAELQRWAEALESYSQAISINPRYVQAHINYANTLLSLQRLDDAILSYENALKYQPDNPSANWNLAHTLLLKGDFARGWDLYEWRWEYGDNVKHKRNFKVPVWQGLESIKGKKIFLYAEQGLGDTIQFVRYVKLVKQLGATVLLEVPKTLIKLLESNEDVDALLETGQALPEFDLQSPLISLPKVFGTNLNSIPCAKAYLRADKDKACYWQERLGYRSRLKVGVVWSGGFRPEQTEGWAKIARRNIPLDIFAMGLNSVNADFFSLQKGDPGESEIRNRENQYWPKGNFYNYADELSDFTDTAALIENLDLVLSVDTSTAHLAAAMGKPTWLLNRYDTCWRWLLDRDYSPWYDAVKLYRQSEDRHWEGVLSRVADDLNELSIH